MPGMREVAEGERRRSEAGRTETPGRAKRQQSTEHELLLAVIATSTALMDLVRVSAGESR